MPYTISHPDVDGETCRVYDSNEADAMRGKMVICDMKDCPEPLCAKGGFGHNRPHKYDDLECFASCCHPGRTGFCVPVDNEGGL